MPTSMVAQTEYDNTVTFTALACSPEGYTNETYAKLFDGKKTSDNFSKWCCGFDGSAYVVFEASKAGIPVGYTITTGNDNSNCSGRNPLSWKLYGNNEGKDGAWTLIQEVSNDTKLQDKNYTSYDFTCEGSTSYKYFKWEISAIHSGNTLQVGEFELKLQICSHKNADGSSALGKTIETVGATCIEHGYTKYECSICHSIVKEYKNDELKKHNLTHYNAKEATCTEAGKKEYWQCSVCNKLFSDNKATTEITDAASLEIPANGHKFNSEGTCTVCQYKDSRYALFNNLDGITGVTITDNGSYPWQMLNLKAEGMENLGFTFPEGSNVLMSSNYNVNKSSSEIVIKFNVSKPILLTSQVLVSSEKQWDRFLIYVDGKKNLCISGKKQTEYKVLLSAGEHSLTLSYQKDDGYLENADRAFLYNLKTSTTIDDYVADYESSNNTLTFKKIKSDNLGTLDLNRTAMVYNEQTVSNMCSLLGISESTIKNIVFDQSINTYTPTSLNSFFQNLYELQTITGFKYLNTAKVTDMSYMFFNCLELSSLDLTNFNTANVTDMHSLFDYCLKLSSLDLTNFNTAKVTNMTCMFRGCSSLTSLDLTNFNTEKVTEMESMFSSCSALETIYASDKFVTTKVTNGSDMFYECDNLKGFIEYKNNKDKKDHNYANYSTGYFTPGCGYAEFDNATGTLTFSYKGVKPEGAYDLSVKVGTPKWNKGTNVKKVVFNASFASARPTICYAWFYNNSNLTTIEGLEYLNTEDVTDMGYMFANCSALKSLNLSMFNTEKTKNMGYMFRGCSNLTSLDLSSFNTKGVEVVNRMFKECSNLTTIYVSANFAFGSVKDGAKMFYACKKIKGFKGYTVNVYGYELANYTTGYLKKLVGKNGDEKIGAAGKTLTAESLALADDKDFVAYEPFAATKATYNRTMKEGTTWATLCLPFEVSLDGQNFRAFKLLSADEGTNTVELEEIKTNIEAGTPVIIKMNEGQNTLDISEADKDIAQKVVSAADGNYQLQGLYTKKVFDKVADNNCYIVKDNKLMNPAKILSETTTKAVGSKPFRAYMVDNSTTTAGAKMFSIGFDDNTTAIDSLNTIANDNAIYYDLQGKRLNAPQKGINIVKRGGKTMKVIIK